LTAAAAPPKTAAMVQNATKGQRQKRNGTSLAVHDAPYTPSWKEQLHTAVIIRPDRERIAEPECRMWAAHIHEALRTAEFVGTGRRPACMSGSYVNRLHVSLREEAISLIAWSDSYEVGGLRWVGDMLESATGCAMDVGRIAALVREMVGHVAAEPKPRRRATVAVIDRSERAN